MCIGQTSTMSIVGMGILHSNERTKIEYFQVGKELNFRWNATFHVEVVYIKHNADKQKHKCSLLDNNTRDRQ